VSDHSPGPAPGSAPVSDLASRLVEAGGGAVSAILLYGSQLLRARPDIHSAYDLVVIVEGYPRFYRAMRASGELPRPRFLMTWMAGVLPPNVIAFAPEGERGLIAKCLIISHEHFAQALGSEPPDHFLLGRMVQRVEVLWSDGAAEREWVEARLAEARAGVLAWMAPYLEGSFDAAGLGRRLLEVCYRGELRPEAKDRADTIYEAQADHFAAVFPPVLEQAARDGDLVREAGAGGDGDVARYRLASAVSRLERRRWRWHFRRSKVRATARWFKHMVTFANWLPYIVRKVERHTGRTVELTPLERKLPLIFLWPRAIHVLLSRPRGEAIREREIES
jgi:hypothetical protein